MQHFAFGKALNYIGMENVDGDSWDVIIQDVVTEPQLRAALDAVARNEGWELQWEFPNAEEFDLGFYEGHLVDPEWWFCAWLERFEAQALLAVLSGGESYLPAPNGQVFELVSSYDAIARITAFTQQLTLFVESSKLHPIEEAAEPTARRPTAAGWQLTFFGLTRESSTALARALERAGIATEVIDPRDRFLLLGDRSTAQTILAAMNLGPTYLPDWDEEGYRTLTADEARFLLEGHLADDLALFLQNGYPFSIEIEKPATEIPVASGFHIDE